MHELDLAQRIVDAAVEAAGGLRLRTIEVRIGARLAADPELLREAFDLAATGTPAEDATLVATVAPIHVSCRACGAASDAVDGLAPCSRCGSFDVARRGGGGIEIESIRVSEPGSAPS